MTSISVVINPYAIQVSEDGEIVISQRHLDGSEQHLWLTLDQVEIFCAHLNIIAGDLRKGISDRGVQHG